MNDYEQHRLIGVAKIIFQRGRKDKLVDSDWKHLCATDTESFNNYKNMAQEIVDFLFKANPPPIELN